MPANAPTHLKQPRRLTIRRVLLAVVLGPAAWWGVGWWVSPKPLYTLRFPDAPALVKFNDGGPPLYVTTVFAPFDRDGRWFILQQSGIPDAEAATMSLVDASTGRVVAAHVLRPVLGPRGYRYGVGGYPWPVGTKPRHDAEPGGTIFLDELEDGPDGMPCRRLYSWNLLTGSKSLVKQCAAGTRLTFSRDGTTLVEEEVLSPLLPCLLTPSPVLSRTVSALVLGRDDPERSFVQEDYARFGPSLFRVWSLPDVRPVSAFALPPPYTFSMRTLSRDGRWLTFSDVNLYGGVSSDRREVRTYSAHSGRRRRFTERIYARSPSALLVYDTQSGRRWYEETGYAGFLAVAHPAGPPGDLVGFAYRPVDGIGPVEGGGRKARQRVLHIPSRSWVYDQELQVEEGVNETLTEVAAPGRTQATRWVVSRGLDSVVSDTDARGRSKPVKVLVAPPESLIAGTTQYVTRRLSEPVLPPLLVDWLRNNPRWAQWAPRQVEQFAVLDYEAGRTLWKLDFPSSESSNPLASDSSNPLVTVTKHHLIFDVTENAERRVTVLQLPLQSWSPWWTRAAGLLVAVLVLMVRRRRRFGMQKV